MGRTRRGLADIHTHSGRVDQTSIPHRAYLRLSCLEMEKARLGKERNAALARVALIDRRFEELDAEKKVLVTAMESQAAGPAARPARIEPASAPRRSAGAFRVRY